MKIHLTRIEDETLWLIQRKSTCLDVSRALKISPEKVYDALAALSKKLNISITPKEVNNGTFWKQFGEHVPFGEK